MSFGREVAPNGSILQLSVDLQDVIGNGKCRCHFHGNKSETPFIDARRVHLGGVYASEPPNDK